MIQEQMVSTHVIFHVVHEADVTTRTSDDILGSGVWPKDWDPRGMLGDVNEGRSIFKGNSMTVLTPLKTKGKNVGMPIEVPQGVYMIVFIDLKVLVKTGQSDCYFAANGQLLTQSVIPTGAISMITNYQGQILHNTPELRLLWRTSRKDGNEYLVGTEFNAQGDGTAGDAKFGQSNVQVAGRLQMMANKHNLNNPDWTDYSMKELENGNHIVRAPVGLVTHVSDDGVHPNPTTMVGLRVQQDDAEEAKEAFEQKGFVWMDKEKRVPGPFYVPEEGEVDRLFTHKSNFLTTPTYNLDPDLHHVEETLRKEAHVFSRNGNLVTAPGHLEAVKTFRKSGMGCIYCVTCHGVVSYDIGICRKCPIQSDKMLDEARIALHKSATDLRLVTSQMNCSMVVPFPVVTNLCRAI